MEVLPLLLLTLLAMAQGARGDAKTAGDGVARSTDALGLQLLRAVPAPRNALLSPVSVAMAFGMLYLGARNETAREVARAMNFTADAHRGFKEMLELLQPPPDPGTEGGGREYELELANAVLVEQRFRLRQEYREACRGFYDAAVESVGFAAHPDAALASLNGWVAWRTHDKIPKVLAEPLDPLTKLFLLNAIYFKGRWATRFDRRLTMPDTFYNEGRVPTTVATMRQKLKAPYAFEARLAAHVLRLEYAGGRHLRMLLLLPERRDGLADLEAALEPRDLRDLDAALREVTVQVTLPRFSLSEESDLETVLRSLGAPSLFDAARADLGGVSADPGLHVTRVTHRCALDVGEEGSEAAAATAVSAGVRTGGPLAPLFAADHPFLFFVRDARLDATLFAGRVASL